MNESTYTYTARSATDPQQIATFTLQNGEVAVELGNAFMQQIQEAYETISDESAESGLPTLVKPAVAGTLQKLIEPIPLADFDADIREDALRATAWIRAGGLRLIPIMLTWAQVDNPDSARTFVAELRNRKQVTDPNRRYPGPLDYWFSWILIGLASLVIPLLILRRLQRSNGGA